MIDESESAGKEQGPAAPAKRSPWWRLREWWWAWRPVRCVTCRAWFHGGDFWNPWGPDKGPGLACSYPCMIAARPASADAEIDPGPDWPPNRLRWFDAFR